MVVVKRTNKEDKIKKEVERRIDESIDTVVNRKSNSKKKMDNETKQLIYVLVGIGVVFLLFFGIYYGVKWSNNFNYLGLDWTKENLATTQSSTKLIFYHAMFPKVYNGTNYGVHNLYLRNDPRKNKIAVNIDSLSFGENYIVTSDPELRECSDASLAFYSLGEITVAFPFIKSVKDGSIYSDNVPEGQIYADCSNVNSSTSVIKLIYGNETKIYSDEKYDGCYVIELANCSDILKTSEKFVLNIVEELNFSKA